MNLAWMSVFRKIAESGVSNAKSKAERRNIILTNYISLVAAFAILLLLIGRAIFAFVNLSIASTLLQGSVLFLLPIIANRLGFINASRLMLCWLPALFQIYATLRTIEDTPVLESSTYVGLRFFMLAFSCFPFLVFDIGKKNHLFLLGLLGPLTHLLFFDVILNFFGVGYRQVGLTDTTYEFNNVRVAVSLVIIGSSSFFLKSLIERSDELNEKLIAELEEKNKVIQQQASDEVHQLNQQLRKNLQQLTEREFILNQSQRIAKIGSWDYKLETKSIFWSDEMYNIFGYDETLDLNDPDLSKLLWGDQAAVVDVATGNLLKTGRPFDFTLHTKTPVGYLKWVRIYAFPVERNNSIVGATGICHDITFYKEAEEKIKMNEMKYHSLFEQASDAIMVTDFTGSFTDVNASLCKMFGYTKDELLQRNISSLIEAEHLKANPIHFDKLKIGEHIFSERHMVHKDGTLVMVEANVKKSGDDRIMAIVRDVTELRKVQRQVQISEALFRGAFEDSALGMALVDMDGKWLKVNHRLCSITGYTEEEMRRLTYQDITHPDDLPQDEEIIRKSLSGELETFEVIKRYFHKNGSIIWVSLNVSIIKDTQSKPLYFVVQIEDITERKRSQEELMLSQANLNATINNTEIMIWSVDRNFNLLTFNKPFYDYILNNYGEEIKVGKRVLATIETAENIERTRKWEQIYLRALSGEIVTLENTRFGMDFQYSLSPIIEETKVIGVSIFAENVTERKSRDRELAEANKKIGELRLMSLRSVMNPHFVFNVLNSIQFFIARNDRLNAINYLSTFSKLMRSILTHSVNNRVKLSEEIDMLRNYVELEKTRFEDKFNFVLNIDQEVEAESIEIPSLLIQPYVENAIIHGLYNKIGSGTLTINVRQKDDAIVFEIEDDGIGREAADKLREQNFPVHKSMGIKITEERLKLINEHHNVAFEVDDLKGDAGPSGTKVTVWVKI